MKSARCSERRKGSSGMGGVTCGRAERSFQVGFVAAGDDGVGGSAAVEEGGRIAGGRGFVDVAGGCV